MFNNFKKTATALTCSLMCFGASSDALAIPIDSKLALVIDVSGSVSRSEYNLQMSGYEAAFNNAAVQSNIDSLSTGIAVEVFFFSNRAEQANIETLLTSASDATAFANVIGSLARPFSGLTDPYLGMNLATDWLLDTTTWDASNLIMDVSGDGKGRTALDNQARDNAQSNNITVNGLAIGASFNGCGDSGYFTQNIITSGAQCFQATGFDDFERAVIAKIQAETTLPGGGDNGGGDVVDVSEPGTLALLSLGLLGLGWTRRQSKA